MTAATTIRDLRDLGVTLSARGDKLHVEAPTGILTPSLRAALATQKAELLAALTEPPPEPARSRIVCEYRLQDHPAEWLIVLGAPGERFDQIRQSLHVKFGGRLVQVRQRPMQCRNQ